MAIDQAMLGGMTAQLMDTLEAAYDNDAEITAAALIVAVDHGENLNTVHSTFSPGLSTYEGLGLVEHVSRTLL